jgi:hypothetical protein
MSARSKELLAESRIHFSEALSLAEGARDFSGISRSANRLGWVTKRISGNSEDAEAFYRQALAAATSANRKDLAAFANNNLAGLLEWQSRYAEAIVVLRGHR